MQESRDLTRKKMNVYGNVDVVTIDISHTAISSDASLLFRDTMVSKQVELEFRNIYCNEL